MPETPREYKQRIDEKWEKNEKNKEKLIKKIEGYEILDKGFKEQTKQEILANFEKNQKAELQGEKYTTIVAELGKIDKKYEELEDLKRQLKVKEDEIIDINDEIRKCKIDGVDETTLNLQMVGLNKLKEKLKDTNDKIRDLKNEIKKREQELNEIEEAYGKKYLSENIDSDNTVNNENAKESQQSQIVGKPETLEEFHKQTIKELRTKDKTRKDIIKVLDDGTGIDDSLSEKIRKELYDKFFEYYDEKQGNLRMKSARFIKNINRKYKKYYAITYKCEIGGKPVFEAYRNGKKCVIRGNEQIGLGFDYLYDIKEIGGKPYFRVRKDEKIFVIWGNKKIGDGFDDMWYNIEIGGKPCFKARIGGKYFIMRGVEQYGEIYDNIHELKEIGGKPCYSAEKDGKRCIMWGKEQIGDWFDAVRDTIEIGGKSCFIVDKDEKQYVMWGTEQYSDKFDLVCDIKEIGGKPCFRVQNNGKQCVIRGKEQYSDWYDSLNEPIKVGGKPCFCITKNGKECVIWGKEQYSDYFDVVIRLQEIGGRPCFQAKKDGKWCVMWGAEQYSEWYDEVQELKEIGGKPSFKAEKDGRWEAYNMEINNITGTPREIREKLILQWYEKKLNMDIFFQILDGIPVLDKKTKKKIKTEILRDFYKNYEKARENDEFKKADEQHKKLKITETQLKKQLRENGKQNEKAKKDINMIEKELLEITENAMKLENGFFWKKRKLEKTITRRDELESQRMKLKCDILKLERGKAEIQGKLKEELKKYGPEIDRTVGKNHNIEITGYHPHEFGPTLKLYKRNYYQSVKEKEQYYEKILRSFKYLDFGINEELKNEKMMQLEGAMKNEIENLKLGDDTVKSADETEKWLEYNWKIVLKKLYSLKGEIEKKEDEIKILAAKKDGVSPSESKKISEQELELQQALSKLKSEFESIKNELDKKLNEYDGTVFDWGKIFNSESTEVLNEIEKLKNETTLLGYKERYQRIIEIKENYLKKLFEEIKTTHLGISREKGKEVFDLIKSHMYEELNKFKEGDDMTKLADETEKWLEDNRKPFIERLLDLDREIKKEETILNKLEASEKSASGNELLQIKDEEFNVKKRLINPKEEYKSRKTEIEEKIKRFDGTVIDWTKELAVETWKEKQERDERERLEKEKREKREKRDAMCKKYRSELVSFEDNAHKTWRKDVESYPHGRLYSFHFLDDIAVEEGDRVGLLALYDCSMDRDYTNSYSDPEYSTVLCFKLGNNIEFKKFVYRDAYDADKDDWSNAYKEILDVKLEGNTLEVWLSKGEGWPTVRYEFKIK